MIANGESCSASLLNEELKNCDFVLVLDKAILRVLDLSIRFDALLGDFDNDLLSTIESNSKDWKNCEIIHSPDQNATDFEKGITYLLETNFEQIHVIWAFGKRQDHAFSNISSLGKFIPNIQLLDDYSSVFLLPKEYKNHFEKDTIISLFPLGKVTDIITKNLVYPLNIEDLEIGIRHGNSNQVLATGNIEISYSEGKLLLMICKD